MGRLDGRIEERDLAETAQPPGELDVFHQRNGREAAQRPEGFSPNEKRLIAEKTPAVPAQKPPDHFEPAKTRVALVELAIKRAADDFRIAQRLLEGHEMRGAQNRVGVMKDQNLAGRSFGAEIHLRAAIRLRRAQVNSACRPCRLRRGRVWGSVRHDHFMEGV